MTALSLFWPSQHAQSEVSVACEDRGGQNFLVELLCQDFDFVGPCSSDLSHGRCS